MRSELGVPPVRRAAAGLPYDWTTRFPPVVVSQLLRGRSCLKLLVEHIRLTHAKLRSSDHIDRTAPRHGPELLRHAPRAGLAGFEG